MIESDNSQQFLISNNKINPGTHNLMLETEAGGFFIYKNKACQFHYNNDYAISLHGNIVPRNSIFNQYSHLNQIELIDILFAKYENDFNKYIKGIFTIIIVHDNTIKIFTDHFGLRPCYIYEGLKSTAISNSINHFKRCNFPLTPNADHIALRSILHRIPDNKTPFSEIKKLGSATTLFLKPKQITQTKYWSPNQLLRNTYNNNFSATFNDLAKVLETSLNNFINFYNTNIHLITLTGGKDSRTGIAVLKSLGINPCGFTYGNELSGDAVYAHKLAKAISMSHYTLNPPENTEFFRTMNTEIHGFGNPDINIFRALRLFAFKEMAAKYMDSTSYYAGYMGGEFLMGIYYDNLIFPKSLTEFWENSTKVQLQPILSHNFHLMDIINPESVRYQLYDLNYFDTSLSKKEQQFHGLFEIGIPHHGQDIFLAQQYFDIVFPFFIDIDFLETLFESRYSYLFINNKTNNILKRHKLYEFNLKVQHKYFPEMDNIPFAKRGSYTTEEYLKGRYYWALVKSFRYLRQRKTYPPTYSYGEIFREFLFSHLHDIKQDHKNILNNFFDISKAISELEKISGSTTEKEMHRFSNIVLLNSQLNDYD